MVTYKFPGDKEKNGGPISNSLLSKLQKDILTGTVRQSASGSQTSRTRPKQQEESQPLTLEDIFGGDKK